MINMLDRLNLSSMALDYTRLQVAQQVVSHACNVYLILGTGLLCIAVELLPLPICDKLTIGQSVGTAYTRSALLIAWCIAAFQTALMKLIEI